MGSVLTLVGAIWAWVLQDQRARREHDGELDVGEGQGRLDRIERLPGESRLAQKRLARLEPHFGRLDFDGTISLFNLEEAIEELLAKFVQVDVKSHGIRKHFSTV